MRSGSNKQKNFSPAVCEKLGFYVYRLIDPVNGETFYVGKGTGNRIFSHVNEAIKSEDVSSLKLDRIRLIKKLGKEIDHVIHRHGLTEKEAIEVEAALIDVFRELGAKDITNTVTGHHSNRIGMMSSDDVAALYEAEQVDIKEPGIIININQEWYPAISVEALYEATRKSWVCRPDKHPYCQYAFAVKHGVIRQVYQIDKWYPDPRFSNGKRMMFDGKVAFDMARYLGYSVRHLSRRGGQNPIKWILC